MSFNELAIEKLFWEDAKPLLSPLNPDFVEKIDQVTPGQRFYFYRARYVFGSEILKQGTFHLPTTSGGTIPLLDASVPEEIRHDLAYNLNTNPALIPINKGLELFVTFDDKVIPNTVVQPGTLFGFSRVLDLDSQNTRSYVAISIWDMTAGARSLFMLPKISDTQNHSRLKKRFLLQQERPNSLRDHWQVFREISQKQPLTEQWACEVLFLPKHWIDALEEPEWIDVRCLLLVANRRAYEFWHNAFVWHLTFSHIQLSLQVKCSPHIVDTLKHLFSMATGTAPGFSIANNEELAPVSLIENAYIHDYGLRNYAPLIMQPHHFQLDQSASVYYSLQFPTLMSFSPKLSDSTSAMSDLYEIHKLLERYQTALTQAKFNLQGSFLENIACNTDYTCFHVNTRMYQGIEETEVIPQQDADILEKINAYPDSNRTFPKNSTFLRGSIKVQNTTKT